MRPESLHTATAARTLGSGPTAPRLEVLYANTDRLGIAFDTGLAGRDDRDTFSARLNGRNGVHDYELEGVLQRGDFRGLDIEVEYVSGVVGWTFDHPRAPRVAVRFDAASGDKDRTDGKLNTYNQLYVPPISLRTDLGVSNLVSIQPQVAFRPLPKTTVGLVTAGLWRQSEEDGVYLLSGQTLRSGVEGDASYVGWRYAASSGSSRRPGPGHTCRRADRAHRIAASGERAKLLRKQLGGAGLIAAPVRLPAWCKLEDLTMTVSRHLDRGHRRCAGRRLDVLTGIASAGSSAGET